MGATKDPGQAGASAFAFGGDAVQEGLAKAVVIPRKMLEANLKAGSSLLSFASQRMQAQAEFFGRFVHCANVEEAATLQKDYFETLIGDYSRELNALTELARESSALLVPQTPGGPAIGKGA